MSCDGPPPADDDWLGKFFELSPDPLALLDVATFTYQRANRAAARAVGLADPTELIGRSPLDFAPELQAEGRPSATSLPEELATALGKGDHRFDWRVRTADGRLADHDVVATFLPAGGGPARLLLHARDVSESKRLETSLRISESRWRRVFDQNPMSMQVFAPDGATLQVNRAYGQLFQLTLEDLKHHSILRDEQLLEAGLAPSVARAFAGKVEAIEPIPFQLKARPDQIPRGMRWIGSTMFPVFDLEGRLIEVVCIHQDHTPRKEAEAEIRQLHQSLERRIAEGTAELRRSEERFKRLFEFSPLGIGLVDEQGRFQQANSAFAEMLGYTPEELSSMTYWDITHAKYFAGQVTFIDKLRESGRFGPFEKEYVRKDGTSLPVMLNGMRVVSSTGEVQIWGIAEDITQRRKAEQALRESERKFRTLFETSSQGVMLHENELFSEVNPAAARIFGLSPEEVVGRHPADFAPLFQPDGEPSSVAAQRHIQNCREQGTTHFEWSQLHHEGHEVLMEVTLTRIPDGQNDMLQAVVTDISERKRAENELKRALERERELHQLKSNFVSMVSHEFRTPLGIIQSSAEILDDYLERLDPLERREQLQSIIKNSRRMAGLMEDVLLLGRLDAGRMDFLPSPLDLAALCRRLVDEIHSVTSARCPIEFFTASLPRQTLADERLLRHILLNLLNNAVKYSEPGQPVAFHASLVADAVEFVVRDQGIGIPAEEQSRLFDAFQRGSNVGPRPGTGLGLVIVKRSVELHGGTITLDSDLDAGTTVTVGIPLSPAESSIGSPLRR